MKTKTKRVDKYKNRNKPARKSWQKGQIMQIVRDPIGLFCGRCNAMKDEKTLKCPNRWTVGTLPISMMDSGRGPMNVTSCAAHAAASSGASARNPYPG